MTQEPVQKVAVEDGVGLGFGIGCGVFLFLIVLCLGPCVACGVFGRVPPAKETAPKVELRRVEQSRIAARGPQSSPTSLTDLALPAQTTATLPTTTETVNERPVTKEEQVAWLLSQTIAHSGKETFVMADFARDLVAYEELCRLDPENAEFEAGLEKARATLERIARAEAEGGWVSEEGATTNYVPTKGVTYAGEREEKELYKQAVKLTLAAQWLEAEEKRKQREAMREAMDELHREGR